MLFGFIYQILVKYKLLNDTSEEHLFNKGVSYFTVMLGVVGLGVSQHTNSGIIMLVVI